MFQNHLRLFSILHLKNKAAVQNWPDFTILDYFLRHCPFLDKRFYPQSWCWCFLRRFFFTNAIWTRIETNTLATTVATVGKSGNLPVASFEYTFDHVADVDEDDNDDDVGEDEDADEDGDVDEDVDIDDSVNE